MSKNQPKLVLVGSKEGGVKVEVRGVNKQDHLFGQVASGSTIVSEETLDAAVRASKIRMWLQGLLAKVKGLL